MTPPAPNDPDPPDCDPFARTVRDALGRSPLLRPPVGFAARVSAAALRDRRRRIVRRRVARYAVAASVLVAALVTRPQSTTPLAPATRPAEVAGGPRVGDQVAAAQSALESVSRRTVEEAVAPAQALIPAIESPAFLPTLRPPAADPAAESLAEMPRAVEAGLEPVTNPARRAVSLFLRDVGGFGPALPES